MCYKCSDQLEPSRRGILKESDGKIVPHLKTDRYLYLDQKETRIIWRNVIVSIIMHSISVYGLFLIFIERRWYTWIFAYIYGFLGGLGVTAGAHRLWSHRSYKAKLPLRIFLALCFSIAGQNDLFSWCRDHRMHHKFSETDADPHNSKRGFFFAHIGWLLTKKHPEVVAKGKTLDHSDLLNDPVVAIQRRFFIPLFLTFTFIIPTLLPAYFWSEKWYNALLIAGIWRYFTSLHCTWFVNSAAHMWGDQPYNKYVQARENPYVSFAAFGEGFHNYHHTFPWDYATSELGWKLNPTKVFIDMMSKIGLAYDLKSVSSEMLAHNKSKHA